MQQIDLLSGPRSSGSGIGRRAAARWLAWEEEAPTPNLGRLWQYHEKPHCDVSRFWPWIISTNNTAWSPAVECCILPVAGTRLLKVMILTNEKKSSHWWDWWHTKRVVGTSQSVSFWRLNEKKQNLMQANVIIIGILPLRSGYLAVTAWKRSVKGMTNLDWNCSDHLPGAARRVRDQ